MKQLFFILLLVTQTLFADLNITGKVSKIISDLSNPSVEKSEATDEEEKAKLDVFLKKIDITYISTPWC